MQNFPLSYQTQKMKTSRITLLIFGIVFPLIAASLCIHSFLPIPTPVDISTIDPAAMEVGTVYMADELYIADIYAEHTENERFTNRVIRVEDQYFLCMLIGTEKIFALSVHTKPDDDIMSAINAYLADDEQYLGDLAVSGYFKAEKLSGDILQFYDEAVALYEEYDLGLTPIRINLVYECNGDTDYMAFAADEQRVQRYVSLGFTGIGILCLALSYFVNRSYKKQLALEAEKARAWTTEEE